MAPYAIVGRATQLGTGAFADTDVITAGDIGSIVIAAATLTVLLTTASILDRRDIRA
ncbi:hypothetical protein [Nonomuraea aridisoli]|uniref:hypothetical protein n=1 Tax=Nonomuraea aridisoli TaxID=2070368 RepID=UPI0015E87B46|nr:hypothetical protein [Nonomuraea aridisoli]